MGCIGQFATHNLNGAVSFAGGGGGVMPAGLGGPSALPSDMFDGSAKKKKMATWKKVLIGILGLGSVLALGRFAIGKWNSRQISKACTEMGETFKAGKGTDNWASYWGKHMDELSSLRETNKFDEKLLELHKSPNEREMANRFYNCYFTKNKDAEKYLKEFFTEMKNLPQEAQETLLKQYSEHHATTSA